MKKVYEYGYVFISGAMIYSAIEVAFRGFTHWTMTVTGGIVLLLIYVMNLFMQNKSIFFKCAAGSMIITAVEFNVGCIVNGLFQMNVWDYSNQPLNILGQICPLFTVLWFFLCIPAIFLCSSLEKKVFRSR